MLALFVAGAKPCAVALWRAHTLPLKFKATVLLYKGACNYDFSYKEIGVYLFFFEWYFGLLMADLLDLFVK